MPRGRPRVIVQYLEGGAAAGAIPPAAAAARLRSAAAVLPIDDVCLGWQLPEPLLEAVADAARDLGAAVWLWHPLLSGDGRYVPGPDQARSASGDAIDAPGGLAEFAFDCPVRPGALGRTLLRLEQALDRYPWDGVFLDKIRWPSPTADPSRDLGCFCDACDAAAASAGVDPAHVRGRILASEASRDGRLALVASLLGHRTDPIIERWLDVRTGAITRLVGIASELIRARRGPDGGPLRVGLDVFAPSLAGAVGQEIASLAPLAEFTKAMLYLGTHGPAGMPFELLRLADWLRSAGVDAPGATLSGLVGYPIPEHDQLVGGALTLSALEAELASLQHLAGPRAAAGVDAVFLPGLAVLDATALESAAACVAAAGVPLVVSWDLWHVDDARLMTLAQGLGVAGAAGRTADR